MSRDKKQKKRMNRNIKSITPPRKNTKNSEQNPIPENYFIIIFPLTQENLRCNNNTSTSKLSRQLNYTTFNQHMYDRESITQNKYLNIIVNWKPGWKTAAPGLIVFTQGCLETQRKEANILPEINTG